MKPAAWLALFGCLFITACDGSRPFDTGPMKPAPGEVTVEIKGTLQVGKRITTKWQEVVYHLTGVAIMAPGKDEIDWDTEPVSLGVNWELFLGGDKTLAEEARKLNGKPVIAKGRLFVFMNGFQNMGPKRRFVVWVTSLTKSPDLQVIFEDPLKKKLAKGWSWLREDAKAWRHSAKGLEIRVQPGLAGTVKNALVRPAPDRRQGKYAIEVTVEFTSPPTNQYEQAGLTWYQGDKPVFKLVHEFIDGKTYVIPSKKPTDNRVIQMRLIVSEDQFVAQYRFGAKGEFQTATTGKLPPGKNEKISIQCYNGQATAEHWMRFSDFRVVKLP
jgi:hypothetical protein